MTAPTVSIGSDDYPSYADLDTADTYLAASVTVANWSTASDDNKGKALVSATRLLDRQLWAVGYTTFDLRLAVPAIVSACCELAGMFIDGSTDPLTSSSTVQTIKDLKAGSVQISYFRIDPALAARFPTIIQELVGPYLAGSAAFASVATGYIGGTDQCSAFDSTYGLNRGL
jgi:hypothetical protein